MDRTTRPIRFWFTLLLGILLFGNWACDETYTPKPKGYFRIALPEKKYVPFRDAVCPYGFELPQYAHVVNYHDSVAEPCWKYIRFPEFNAEIFLSYRKVQQNLGSLMEDSRTLAYKHSVKAESIDETVFRNPGKTYGMLYDIGGNAASSVQFYITDSVAHFLRGALYFNAPPQPDSLAPVIRFLREDIIHLMESTAWDTEHRN